MRSPSSWWPVLVLAALVAAFLLALRAILADYRGPGCESCHAPAVEKF